MSHFTQLINAISILVLLSIKTSKQKITCIVLFNYYKEYNLNFEKLFDNGDLFRLCPITSMLCTPTKTARAIT